MQGEKAEIKKLYQTALEWQKKFKVVRIYHIDPLQWRGNEQSQKE